MSAELRFFRKRNFCSKFLYTLSVVTIINDFTDLTFFAVSKILKVPFKFVSNVDLGFL